MSGVIAPPLNASVRQHYVLLTMRAAQLALYAFFLLGQSAMLVLQVRAYRRFKHSSFAFLALGQGLGLIYAAMGAIFSIDGEALSSPIHFYVAAMVIGASQIPIAVWGTYALFKSYGQLHDHT